MVWVGPAKGQITLRALATFFGQRRCVRSWFYETPTMDSATPQPYQSPTSEPVRRRHSKLYAVAILAATLVLTVAGAKLLAYAAPGLAATLGKDTTANSSCSDGSCPAYTSVGLPVSCFVQPEGDDTTCPCETAAEKP